MSGNKAMRRAAATADVIRVNSDIPKISDATELVTPQRAEELLKKNTRNRPVNWRKVEEYARVMKSGQWKLHAQGIILDEVGNILTGQTRLWAIVFSDTAVYIRISRGNPASVAHLLDRGRPQSARDLATRQTEKRHSPTEASIARAVAALRGNTRPSVDELGELIVVNEAKAAAVLRQTSGTRKTKSVLMILAAICDLSQTPAAATRLALVVDKLSESLDTRLLPQASGTCWGRGAAFSLAMEAARFLVDEEGRNLR